MALLTDHPLRYALANELHARPFPNVAAPAQAAYVAMTPAASKDGSADRAQLIALLDRYGAPHPPPEATHYSGQIGQHQIKWERHTEFVTYSVFCEGEAKHPFDGAAFSVFPADWLKSCEGQCITSVLIDISVQKGDSGLSDIAKSHFVAESLALSRMLEDDVVSAADFRIDPAGHTRLAVFARPTTGSQRIGRVIQRLCEIETYKAVAMLGFAMARQMSPELSHIEARLGQLVASIKDPEIDAEGTLDQLLGVSAELADLSAISSYRFGATRAYDHIVSQRIDILREAQFEGHQTFAEFMMRRFEPAMRTVKSTADQLESLTKRAARAGDLLRTQVDVERSTQNRDLLESMDRRADMQLRLQQTVEGLSVVAISYYAVNLLMYLLGPVQVVAGLSKYTTAAIVTPMVLVTVWLMVRRIRQKLGH
mgnify:CR=1 FL=1